VTVILDDQSKEIGTHVLILGVGDYPFLKDGTAPAAKLFNLHMNMGQLSSPPLSASELARWFCDAVNGFNNPDRPLRSLEMLVSEAGGQPLTWKNPVDDTEHVVARAQREPVHQAIRDWLARASLNEDNLAVLYFCGHGLSWGESENSLLLEDFGSNAGDPMADAIAFDELRLGVMRQCEARFQCHFIDACRTLPTQPFVDQYGDDSTGAAVVAGGLSSKLREKAAPVFFAARLASAAYGLKDQPSLFTQGMLRSFRGAASRDADDHWEVTVSAMAEGINKCVESLAFQTQPQFCQPRDTGQPLMLHRLREPPEVIVKVSTRDDAQLPNTILAHLCVASNQKTLRQPPLPVPWWVSLSLGQYTFQAMSADLTVLNTRDRFVQPPGAEVNL
jgi:hypothetical protein